jgi:hypothetical protein
LKGEGDKVMMMVMMSWDMCSTSSANVKKSSVSWVASPITTSYEYTYELEARS